VAKDEMKKTKWRLSGSLDLESTRAREKCTKRRKIKRSQTTENIETAGNLESEELQQFMTQK
jgi:hypothetical protein